MSKQTDRQMGNPEAFDEYGYPYPPEQETAAAARRARQAHKRKRTNGFFKLLILLAIVMVAIIVVQETVLRLETVYVIGTSEKTPQEVVTASGLVSGRNMLSIEEEEVARALARDHSIVFKGMQKEYPSTIYLYVEERRVAAAMQWLGILYKLDYEGVVMSVERDQDASAYQGLPTVTGMMSTEVQVGQCISPRTAGQLEAYCEIVKELDLQMYADQVAEINLADPDNIYLLTVEGVTARLGSADYMQAKIGAVRTYMAYLRQLGKAGGILDVTTPENAKYMPED